MVSSSKILTVSYGTFSCTAEGFDDPLEVVKETTQFFRGVVGEDRFFGSEPPQFDPELASEYLRDRLADSGGTLSLGSPPRVRTAAASAGAMAAAFDASLTRAAPQAEQVEDLLPDDDTIEATAVLTETSVPEVEEPQFEAAPDDPAPARTEAAPAPPASVQETPAPESGIAEDVTPQVALPSDIASKLDRIRAVVARTDDDDVQPAKDETIPAEVPTETHALESLIEALGEEGDADEDIDLDAPSVEDAEETDEALDSALESLVDDMAHDDPKTALPLVAATAAIAGIAATVAQARPEDQVAQESPQDATDPAHDDAETPDDTVGEVAKDGPTDAVTETEQAADAPSEAISEAVTLAQPAPAPISVPNSTPLRARVVKVKRAVFEQAVDEGALEEVLDETPPSSSALFDGGNSSLSPEEEDELARELAAVKAELASDFGAWDEDHDDVTATEADSQDQDLFEAEDAFADDDDDIEAEQDAALIAAAAAAVANSGSDDLHPEQASAPLRLDNPISTPDPDWDRAALDEADDGTRDVARKAVKMASPARALLTEHEVEDGDASRLMDQTDTEMDEPEGNRRRSAIAHLRAAVAATKADRLLGRKADSAEEQEPYREDLASVVRPRRPQSTGTHTERPTAEAIPQTTPLKLVAEQRVAPSETPSAEIAEADPVRPRRVRRAASVARAQEGSDGAPAGDFALYAQSVGAVDLPELLEAAAAYMSYVEGRDQFSRPQLMSTLRQAEAADSTREDRLRSFGQLLREGKIRKTTGGRFTAADHISFKPDLAANG